MKRVLSLDASTTTVGIAVIDYETNQLPKLFYYDYYKPLKDCHQLEMLLNIKGLIHTLIDSYKPDDFAIEEFISFMKGNSTAHTTIPLAVFNRTICLTAYEHMGKLPNILHVSTIRSLIKIDGVTPKKEDVPEFVAKHLQIDFPYYTKIIKKTGATKILEHSYDLADGIAVGLAFINQQNNPKKVKKAKKKK